MSVELPSVLAGRYRLERPLGAGGMAVTYLARDLRLDRLVAVKLQRLELPEVADQARFEREARAAAAVSHPNVVQVYDAGQEGPLRYLVMEWVDGVDLARVIRERAPLPLDEAVPLMLDVLRGLAAIHRVGIVHRDVKPANILLDRDGHAKLTDFGIARRADDPTLTAPVELLGTAPYVAPERVRGQPATPESDLYAAGVVLYELVTGRLPFPGQTPEELLAQHLHAEPQPPRHWRPDLPPALEQVILRALAKDPAARFRSAEAMAAALEAAWRTGERRLSRRTSALATARSSRPEGGRAPSLAVAGGVTVLSLALLALVVALALAVRGEDPASQPTPTALPSPVVALAPTPTVTPSATATPSPVPTPTLAPTPIPTPTPVPDWPSEIEVIPSTPPELRRFSDRPTLELAPSEFAGAYLPSRDGALPGFSRDLANAALLFGTGSGAERASVIVRLPAGTARLLIEIEGRASRGQPKPQLELLIQDRVVWRDENPFPGPFWARTTIVLRFPALSRETPVVLTLRNTVPGSPGQEPWLAVRTLRLSTAD